MATIVALVLLLLPVQVLSREISVDELSLMTLPELAQKAYSECSDQAERIRKAKEYINQAGGGGIGAGTQMFTYADEALAEANVHKENLNRIKLVVRKQLNGEEPSWAEGYTTTKESAGCENAKAQYEEWAREREKTKTPEAKKGGRKKTKK